jgi:hypothetical protein
MNIIVSYRKPLAAGIIIAAVLTTAAYAADEQTMTQPTVTSHTIAVEHIRIASGRPFAEVRQRLESAVPELDPSIAEALARGDQERAQAYHDNGPSCRSSSPATMAPCCRSPGLRKTPCNTRSAIR